VGNFGKFDALPRLDEWMERRLQMSGHMFFQRLDAFLKGLSQRPYLRSVLANTGWLMLDRLLRALLGVFVGAWVARYLGPERYGELAYAIAFLTIFQSIANLSLDGILVRDISQYPEQAPYYLGTALRLRLMVASVAWLGACLLVALIRPDDFRCLLMVALLGCGMVFQSTDVIDLWFQSQMQSRLSVLSKAFGYCSASVIKVALILSQAPLWTFALALLLDAVLAAVAISAAYRRFPTKQEWSWDALLAVKMLKEALPFLLTAFAIAGYMRADQIILRQLAGEQALGLYSAVLPFSQVWQMLPIAAYSSLLPRISSLRLQDEQLYQRRLQQIFTIFMWGGVLSVAVTFFSAGWILHALLGSRFVGAASILKIHVVTNVFIFLGLARSMATVADRKAHIGLLKALSGMLASVAGNLLLIPRFGVVGAAWSAVLAQAVSSVAVEFFLDPKIFWMQLRAIFGIRWLIQRQD
jgi:O-antigen/teichoic acid export membrane protein